MKTFSVKNIAKHYGKVKAVDGITLSAEMGSVFGLLGPNGAGKTTLIRLLSTLIEPTKGEAKVLDYDVSQQAQKVREVIGLAGQYAAVDEYLTGRENIYMVGRLYHLSQAEAKKRTEEILRRLRLADAANRQVKTYSGGMRRRLDLGASLVGRPKVLFLDEPTTGLDPRTRLELWDIIKELKDEGTGIILTTQYLEEADELADKIAVIDHGKVIAEGTSDQLKKKLGGEVVEIGFDSAEDQTKALTILKGLAKKPPKKTDVQNGVSIAAENGSKTLLKAVEVLNASSVKPAHISLHKPSLDDVFLSLTGKKTSQAPEGKEKP